MSIDKDLETELKALIENYGKRLFVDDCLPDKIDFYEYRRLLRETRSSVAFAGDDMKLQFEE